MVPFFYKQKGCAEVEERARALDRRTYDEYPAIVPRGAPTTTERRRKMALLRDRFEAAAIAAE